MSWSLGSAPVHPVHQNPFFPPAPVLHQLKLEEWGQGGMGSDAMQPTSGQGLSGLPPADRINYWDAARWIYVPLHRSDLSMRQGWRILLMLKSEGHSWCLGCCHLPVILRFCIPNLRGDDACFHIKLMSSSRSILISQSCCQLHYININRAHGWNFFSKTTLTLFKIFKAFTNDENL